MDEGCGVLSNSGMTTFIRKIAFELFGLVPLTDLAEHGRYEHEKFWKDGLME
jgi:hypothetical protein